MAVRIDARGGTWAAGGPAKVVDGPYLAGTGNAGRSYDISSEGRRFLMVKLPAAAPQIVIV